VKALRNLLLLLFGVAFVIFLGAPFILTRHHPSVVLSSTSPSSDAPAVPGSEQETPPPPAPVAPPRSTPPVQLTPRLTLLEPVTFPVSQPGDAKGAVRAQAGINVDLVADQGPEVVVRLVNSTATVPRSVVAPTNEVATAPEPAGIVGAARETGQKIVDYWFPAAPASLSLEAHERGTSRSTEHNWETWWGSYNRDYLRTKTVYVEVRNVSRRASGPCELSIFWIGKRVADDHRFIHHRVVHSMDVANLSSEYRDLTCPPIKANTTNYELAGVKYESGAKIEGWMVVLRRDSKTINCVASSPSLKAVGENEQDYSALLGAENSNAVKRTFK
jgi:hypothetical protein